MDIIRIRQELRSGKSIFNLPLRVTFYARVSTDQDAQLNSLENQVQYYTELIQNHTEWTYVDGYIDEGISGTSTKKRDSFNRMIADAKEGKFDFIITKEISRFSRSTLDSIQFTQQLLEYGVGVLFQNDHINTLDPDSEFRLVVMAGVAQDEVRKLSERLKFGFRQAIKNGHVLGNDRMWGYDKKNCMLTINEEAGIIHRIFELYANEQVGVRRIAQILYNEGITGRNGNPFNSLTIRHILCNPKYKGWYCGHKSQSADYRSKRKILLDESEWVLYPDPNIPAIVSEELWDRANALYRQRSKQMMVHRSAASFHNRYPYSGKIICEAHDTSFHRQLLKNTAGTREVWQCRIYREHGRKACSAPQLYTDDLNAIMAEIFKRLRPNQKNIIDVVTGVIQSAASGDDVQQELRRIEGTWLSVCTKKEHLLSLSMVGAISAEEFKQRNDALNEQVQKLEEKREKLRADLQKNSLSDAHLNKIREHLVQQITFEKGTNPTLVTAILDHIEVKACSTREQIHLDIYLKCSAPWEGVFKTAKTSFCVRSF